MAKAVPVGGFLALSGRVGSLVFCRRGNRLFVRQWVRPKDPKSLGQLERRGRFSQAVAAWRALSDEEKDSYRERAKWQSRSGYNLFVSEHLSGG